MLTYHSNSLSNPVKPNVHAKSLQTRATPRVRAAKIKQLFHIRQSFPAFLTCRTRQPPHPGIPQGQRCTALLAQVRPQAGKGVRPRGQRCARARGAHPPEKSQAAGRRSAGKAEKTSWQWEDNRTRNVIFANGCLPTTADKAFRPKHALTQLDRRKAHNHRKDTV